MYEGKGPITNEEAFHDEMRSGSANKISVDKKSVLEHKHEELTDALDRLGIFLNDLESKMAPVLGPTLNFAPDDDTTSPEQCKIADLFDGYISAVKVSTDRVEHVLRRAQL